MQFCFRLLFVSVGATLALGHGVKSVAEPVPESAQPSVKPNQAAIAHFSLPIQAIAPPQVMEAAPSTSTAPIVVEVVAPQAQPKVAPPVTTGATGPAPTQLNAQPQPVVVEVLPRRTVAQTPAAKPLDDAGRVVPAAEPTPAESTPASPSPKPEVKPLDDAGQVVPAAEPATQAPVTPATQPSATPPMAAPASSDPARSTPAQSTGQSAPATSASDANEVPTLPNGKPYKPIGPAKPGNAPESLNPDTDPLQFPTNPEEVTLRGIQPITLKQAIELAERNNRNLQVTQLQVERNRGALRQAQAALYPTLDLQLNLTNSRSTNGSLSNQNQLSSIFGQQNNNGASTSLSGSLGLSYDVFTFGRRPAQIRAAERQLRSAELDLETTREQLRLDVSGDYYNLQEADEAVRINLAAVRNNETSLRDAQALEQAGLGTRFDVLRAEVQLSNSRQDLTNSLAQQQISRRQLAQRLSLPEAFDLAAADPVEIAGKWELPLADSVVLAYKNRAELEQQLVQRELADQQRKASLAALGPRITLSAQYNLLNVADDDLGTADGYSLQAGLNWSVFDGGAARAAAAQQEVNGRIAETRFADVRNQVRFQVEQAYANLVSNRQNIDTTNLGLQQAREALRLARLRFQAGVGTQTEVINAETDLTRAEGNRLTAILGYNRALAALKRAITNLFPGTNALPVTTPYP